MIFCYSVPMLTLSTDFISTKGPCEVGMLVPASAQAEIAESFASNRGTLLVTVIMNHGELFICFEWGFHCVLKVPAFISGRKHHLWYIILRLIWSRKFELDAFKMPNVILLKACSTDIVLLRNNLEWVSNPR